jgi:hypothetical protein
MKQSGAVLMAPSLMNPLNSNREVACIFQLPVLYAKLSLCILDGQHFRVGWRRKETALCLVTSFSQGANAGSVKT